MIYDIYLTALSTQEIGSCGIYEIPIQWTDNSLLPALSSFTLVYPTTFHTYLIGSAREVVPTERRTTPPV